MTNSVALRSMSVTQALEWEKKALRDVMLDQTPRFLIWEPVENVMVLPASSKWKTTTGLSNHMAKHGWQLEQRKTGGSPVPQTKGVFNLSIVYPWPNKLELSTTKSYQLLVDILEQWLSKYGISTHTGEVQGAYCNGTFNLSINNKKIIGTAQRMSLNNKADCNIKAGVLAHAFILINPDISKLVNAVNECYFYSGQSEVFNQNALVSLLDYNKEINKNQLADELYHTAESLIAKHLVIL